MIVGPVFPGDEHHDLRRVQQREIGRAVSIIVSEARSRWEAAEALLDVRTPLGIAVSELKPNVDLIDDGAEYLAAIWRIRNHCLEPRLPLDGPDPISDDLEAWLEWLRMWIARECPPGVMRALLSCAYEPDERAVPQHDYLVRWLRDWLGREVCSRRAPVVAPS